MITKQTLANDLAQDIHLSRAQTHDILTALDHLVVRYLQQGHDVRLLSLGTLSVKHQAARPGRNPATGEEVTIEARNVPRLKISKTLKDAVN